MQKANLPEARDNDTITRKVCVDRNKLCPGMNGGNIPSILGDRSISVGRQAGRQSDEKFWKILQLQFNEF